MLLLTAAGLCACFLCCRWVLRACCGCCPGAARSRSRPARAALPKLDQRVVDRIKRDSSKRAHLAAKYGGVPGGMELDGVEE